MLNRVDKSLFRQAMAQFVTGVTVVTSVGRGEIHGMTCNAFTSVSFDPPTLLVCLTAGTRTCNLISTSKVFGVNILSEAHQHISNRFAGRDKDLEADRFSGMVWEPSLKHGVPVFVGVGAFLDCEVIEEVTSGDHVIFIGRVADAKIDIEKTPLGFYRSRYVGVQF